MRCIEQQLIVLSKVVRIIHLSRLGYFLTIRQMRGIIHIESTLILLLVLAVQIVEIHVSRRIKDRLPLIGKSLIVIRHVDLLLANV